MGRHPSQYKALSLFKYLYQLCSQKQAKLIVTDIEKEPVGQDSMYIYAQDIPGDSAYITVGRRGGDDSDGAPLLSIRKPGSRPCPSPDASLIAWLMPGWEDYHKDAGHRAFIDKTVSDPEAEAPSEDQTSLPDMHETEASAENEQSEI